MTHCAHCGQTAHSNILEYPAVAYALDDKTDYCDLSSTRMSKRSITNAKLRRRKTRGKIPVFGSQSKNYIERDK